MKTYKELALDIVTKVDEDAPANAVGTGANVALPPTHEPGVDKKKKKKKHDPILINNLKRKVQENNDNNSVMLKGVLDKLEELDNIVDDASGVKKNFINDEVETKKEYLSFKDKYMGELLNETDTGRATKMEQAICVGFNYLKGTKEIPKESDDYFKSNISTKDEDTARASANIDVKEWQKVKQDIRLEGLQVAKVMRNSMSGTMIHYGRGKATNKFASVMGLDARDTTPKTDVILSSGGNRCFSLKDAGGAQLLSPKGGEATGVVKAAILNLGKEVKELPGMERALESLKNEFNKMSVDDAYVPAGDAKRKFVAWYTTQSGRKEQLQRKFSDANAKQLETHMKTELAPFKATNFKEKGSPSYNKNLLGFDKKSKSDPKTGIDLQQYQEYLKSFAESDFEVRDIAIKDKYLKTNDDKEFVKDNKKLLNKCVDFLDVAINQTSFKNAIENVFTQNKDLRKYVVYEGATGHFKFAGTDKNKATGTNAKSGSKINPAIASEILTFSSSTRGARIKIDSDIFAWSESNASICDNLQFAFKGSDESKKRYTKFAMMIPARDLAKQEVRSESWKKIINGQIELFQEQFDEVVDELNYLEEGILDYVRGKIDDVATVVKKMYNKVKDLILNFYNNVIKAFISKAFELLKKSLNAFLDFLGLDFTARVSFR